MTQHQLLQDYGRPLGNGNNMFISVSAPGDLESAPAGYRAVMVSTHCDLAEWPDRTPAEYAEHKRQIGERLLGFARRVYPHLGARPCVYEVGTPRTYARFTGRPDGAVSGVRQRLGNANQFAISHHTSLRGFWLAGDSTWPGLGTGACALGSRIVAEAVVRAAGPATHTRAANPAWSRPVSRRGWRRTLAGYLGPLAPRRPRHSIRLQILIGDLEAYAIVVLPTANGVS